MMQFPTCLKCNKGVLVPLSGIEEGIACRYKAWACTNPACAYNIQLYNEIYDLSINRTVWDGQGEVKIDEGEEEEEEE